MKPTWIVLTTMVFSLICIPSLKAADRASTNTSTITAQTSLDRRQVLEACVQNRAEALPNPFTDVPANHWAFKAVMTLHYCGPFRQATPRSFIERQPETVPSERS